MITIRRVYEDTEDEGVRILVDRLWPRGVRKERITVWMKEIAPSDELRRWYSHDPEKCSEFKTRYFKELDSKTELVRQILEYAKKGSVILLYSTKASCSNAETLLEYLQKFKQS